MCECGSQVLREGATDDAHLHGLITKAKVKFTSQVRARLGDELKGTRRIMIRLVNCAVALRCHPLARSMEGLLNRAWVGQAPRDAQCHDKFQVWAARMAIWVPWSGKNSPL